jgi:transposase-like protein
MSILPFAPSATESADATPPGVAVCPLCHTASPRLEVAGTDGGSWRCSRCLQSWSAERLATVAAYRRMKF